MKKISILGIFLIGLVLSLYLVCFATPVPTFVNGQVKNGLERIERQPVSLKNKTVENEELGIEKSIQGPLIDEDGDGFCSSYSMSSTYKVPPEGATFYSVYYFRTKSQDGEWGEWKKTFTGSPWYWSQEDARNYYSILINSLLDESDGDIPPSRAQFKQELYNAADNTLADAFETSSNGRKYWSISLVESKNNDSREESEE